MMGWILRNGIRGLVFVILAAGPAWAEGKDKEPGNLIRISIFLPLLSPGTANIARQLPVSIDINFDSEEAKNSMVNSIPKLQAAYLENLYGKLYTNTGFDILQGMLQKITEKMADEDIRSQIHLTIRLNVKQG